VTDAECLPTSAAVVRGEVVPPVSSRLLAVFDGAVGRELADLATRAGWEARLVDGVEGLASVDADTYVVLCDHHRDEVADVLEAALASPARWIGLMGTPRRAGHHWAALRERGLPDTEIARIHRPIGIDIGSKTPVEIAVSTLAGLLADRNDRPGTPYPQPEPPPLE
jgi:xanthine dehydrogenase accessory factor